MNKGFQSHTRTSGEHDGVEVLDAALKPRDRLLQPLPTLLAPARAVEHVLAQVAQRNRGEKVVATTFRQLA